MQPKANEREIARGLFFQTDLPQTEIAKQAGIGERTLSRWVNEGQWRKIRNAARHMPAQIVDNFQAQLVELQETIMSRPKGERFATDTEAAVMAKLVLCIARMKVQVTGSNSIQVLMNYIDLIKVQYPEFAVEATKMANEFLTGKAKDGFEPFDIGYDPGLDDIEELGAVMEETNAATCHDTPIPANDSDATPTNTVADHSENNSSKPADHFSAIIPPITVLPDLHNTSPSTCIEKGLGGEIDPYSLPELPRAPAITGLTWLGHGFVRVHENNIRRKITTDEWNAFLNWGYTLTDMGNYQFQSDPAYDEEIRKAIAEKTQEQAVQRQRIEQFKESMKRNNTRRV